MASRRAVILGGGLTGVLTARELAKAGFDVTVLEAMHIGAGSSSRTAAGIRQQFSTPETVRGMRYAVAWYAAFGEEAGESPLVQNGYLFLHDASQWAAAKARVAMQREAGLAEVVALETPELLERFPWVSPDVTGGTYCPTDGFLLPAVVYNEGARRARELGATIVQGAPVVSARSAGGRLVSVTTPKGDFSGDVFLDCTNAWSRRTARILGAEELPVDPLKRYLWFLARDGGLDGATLARMPLVIAPSGVYCRPENADRLLMGWAHETPPEVDFSYEDQDRVDPGYAHNSGIDAKPYEAWAKLAEAIPLVGEFAGIVATTSGFYANTPDHNPFLGYDRRLANLIRLVGFSGHGAMFGPFTARVGLALAEAGRDVPTVKLDAADEVPIAAFRIGREFGHAESMVI